MADSQKPVPALVISRAPIVNPDGTARWEFLKILQGWATQIANSLNSLGQFIGIIGTTAKVAGRVETIGLTLQNIGADGVISTDNLTDGAGSPLAGGAVAFSSLVNSAPVPGNVLKYSGTDWTPGDAPGITQLTGDVTAGPGSGSVAATVVATHLAAPLPVAQGGSGTATPSLVGGANVTISGTWPNQTVAASGGGGGGGGFQTLTDAPVIAWNVAAGNGVVTLGGNRTIANPTGMVAGQMYFLIVKQDATGGRTLDWSSSYLFPGGAISLSQGANAVDSVTFISDGTYLYCTGIDLNEYASIAPNYPGLKLWLKADAISGVPSGSAVATWIDSSGVGNNATQTTPAKQPTYNTNVINGLPAVSFVTSGVGMSTSLNLASPFTIFVVYRMTVTPGGHARAIQGLTNNWLEGPYGGAHSYFNGAFITGPVVTQNVWVIVAITSDNSGTQTFYVNNLAIGSSSSSAAPGLLCIGGGVGAFSEVLGGDEAEILGYNVALSSSQIGATYQYLKNKYNL